MPQVTAGYGSWPWHPMTSTSGGPPGTCWQGPCSSYVMVFTYGSLFSGKGRAAGGTEAFIFLILIVHCSYVMTVTPTIVWWCILPCWMGSACDFSELNGTVDLICTVHQGTWMRSTMPVAMQNLGFRYWCKEKSLVLLVCETCTWSTDFCLSYGVQQLTYRQVWPSDLALLK